MKQLLFLLLPLLFFACKSEESITPAVTFERDFAVVDNAADPVQHARYEIYKKYGVPVYFNDTVAVHGGTAPADSASRRYETVDLNWTFFGYSRGVEYRYDYLRTAEEQLRALRFVDAYLSKISRQMRPFSVMVADTLTVSSANKVEKPIYHVGFRTLVLARVKDITVEDSVNAQIAEIVNSMVSDRIKANRELCGEFADVSTQKGWYDLDWKRLNETSPCPTVIEMGRKSYVLSVNALNRPTRPSIMRTWSPSCSKISAAARPQSRRKKKRSRFATRCSTRSAPSASSAVGTKPVHSPLVMPMKIANTSSRPCFGWAMAGSVSATDTCPL